jgi:hypothetical protein
VHSSSRRRCIFRTGLIAGGWCPHYTASTAEQGQGGLHPKLHHTPDKVHLFWPGPTGTRAPFGTHTRRALFKSSRPVDVDCILLHISCGSVPLPLFYFSLIACSVVLLSSAGWLLCHVLSTLFSSRPGPGRQNEFRNRCRGPGTWRWVCVCVSVCVFVWVHCTHSQLSLQQPLHHFTEVTEIFGNFGH